MVTSARTVLISGASIAGPALGYWLHRYGFEVTIVEKAGALRGGGYPIDIRGTAVDVVDRMGLLPRLRAAHIDSRRITFLNADGTEAGAIRPEALTGGVEGRDLELPRGDLADALAAAIDDDVEFRFGDSIDTLHQDADGVDVEFRSGTRRRFDLVIGADGLHSRTRGLVFGPEERFHHYLGHCFAGFTLPNDLGLAHEAVAWNTPGRTAVLYAAGDAPRLHGFLTFVRDEPPLRAFEDPAAQRALVADVFAGAGWEVPRLLAAMNSADDLFFDVVSQIRMPGWSAGRVALTGDAAHAPSFFSGQGSSIALVGAYVLAGELATAPDHGTAFAAYERRARRFVEQNQDLAFQGSATLSPRTAEDIERRNQGLRAGAELDSGRDGWVATTAIALPAYAA